MKANLLGVSNNKENLVLASRNNSFVSARSPNSASL